MGKTRVSHGSETKEQNDMLTDGWTGKATTHQYMSQHE